MPIIRTAPTIVIASNIAPIKGAAIIIANANIVSANDLTILINILIIEDT